MPETDPNNQLVPLDDEDLADGQTDGLDDADSVAPSTSWLGRWANVWHLPLLMFGVGLMALGVYLTLPKPVEHDFDGALDSAQQYIMAGNAEGARTQLATVAEHMDKLSEVQAARHVVLHADLLYREQHQSPVPPTAESLQQVVKLYREADAVTPLSGKRLQRMAELLIALGREDAALKMIDRLNDAPAERRVAVVRRVIENRRKRPDEKDGQSLLALIERYDTMLREVRDADARRAGQIWSTALRARLALEAGDPDSAGRIVELAIPRFMDTATGEDKDKDLGPLQVVLGLSHQRKGEYEDAERWFLYAQDNLPRNHARQAEAYVGLGQVAQASGGKEHIALQQFSIAEEQYPGTSAYPAALMGRADTEARLGMFAEGITHFTRAVDLMLEPNARPDDVDRLRHLLRARFSTANDTLDYDAALEYLTLLRRLAGDEKDADLEALFASTHDLLSQQYDTQARDASAKADAPDAIPDDVAKHEAATRLARQNAAVHADKAGDYYLRHARLVTINDDDLFGQSLWRAAESYDKARQWKKAIEVWAEYVKARPEDPRRLDAIHRLGLAYEADKQFAPAVGLFRELIETSPRAQQTYDSLVPLARSYIELKRFDEAKQVLRSVVTNHEAITPDSIAYRQALIALGRLHYRLNEYEEAIERLEVAVARYGDTDEGAKLRFAAADAYRQSATPLAQEMTRPMPETRRAELKAEHDRRLDRAAVLFSQVVNELESDGENTLDDLSKLYLRNAYFYRGDCLYDRGQYEQAIDLYAQAVNRYDKHPASLVGLIQIVNANCELERFDQARIANDRARWQLKQIPEAEFDDPTLPMSREHWQTWLKWTTDAKLFSDKKNRSAAVGP